MMVNLLVVEDRDEHIKEWETVIKRHNAVSMARDDGSIRFHIEIAKNKDEALKKLHTYNFSVAIIDIRLKREGEEEDYNNTDGIDVLKEIMSTVSCYSVIYTGQSKDAEATIENDYQEYIKIVDRDTSKSNLIKSLVAENKEIILSINDLKYKFSKSMSSLFYRSIWPRWNYWEESEGKKEALSRHMASHLHASFLNETIAVHPEEYYFIPPLQDRLDTGDIILQGDSYYILATPRCDLARAQNPTFQLVKLANKKADWDALHQEKVNGTKKEKEKATRGIRNLINHGDRSPKLHFIPQFKLSSGEELGPFHAQFNFMTCIEATIEARSNLSELRVATLSNEFVPSLVERLGAYFSRIGTPDYSHPE